MIRIQNIYYMLAYAFQVLNEQGYRSVATEEFENTAELFAAILECGVSKQIKRGLGKDYHSKSDSLYSLRGKINITESIKTQAVYRNQMVCAYDEFTSNSYMNRIIKSTIVALIKGDISKAQKKRLKKLLVYLTDVELIDLHTVNWNMQYNRNNQTYRMMISVCYLVVKGLLQTKSDGTTKLMDFLDDQRMSRLYEKFILEYYRREYPQLNPEASQIHWQLDDGVSDMLPMMQTDIMLSYGEKVLIIDAKCYDRMLQTRFEKNTVRSAHLYQIFTYVKNKEAELKGQPHEVAGMLLYAKTDEDVDLNQEYKMSGNRISVKTLDLNTEFSVIKKQLDGIAGRLLGQP